MNRTRYIRYKWKVWILAVFEKKVSNVVPLVTQNARYLQSWRLWITLLINCGKNTMLDIETKMFQHSGWNSSSIGGIMSKQFGF